MVNTLKTESTQLDLTGLDPKDALMQKESVAEAFEFVFSKEYLNYAYDTSVGLKRGRGIDGITLKVFDERKEQEFDTITRKVIGQNYRFTPYLEVLKSKGRGKAPRILSTPTMRDKLVLFCLKDFLQYLYNNEIPKLHASEHVSRLCNTLTKNSNIKEYYRGDLQNFYPSIPREKLIRKLKTKSSHPPFIHLVQSALKTPTRPITDKGLKQSGVPQGLSISNILADIYLIDLDKGLKKTGAFCGRFVDDVVFAGNKTSLIKAILFLKYWLFMNGLKLNKEKSSLGKFRDGIDYLGYNIKKKEEDSEIHVGVRKSSQQRLIESLCGLVTSYKHSKDNKHLHRLNRRISGVIWKNKRYGWLFYFSELNDLSILRKFDSIVSELQEREKLTDYKFKKFVNSFWRIKKRKWGDYITNFDEYTPEQMREHLITALDKTKEEIDKLTYPVLYRLFSLEVQKEIDKMEQDVGDLS